MNNRFMNLVLSLLSIIATASQAQDYGVLYKNLQVAWSAEENVVYGHKDGLALTMDVVTPSENSSGLGIILVSSGGWNSSKSNVPGKEFEKLKDHWAMGLLKEGFTVFIVRHGSTPRYFVPEMVQDITRSIRFVRFHAEEYGVEPGKLGITSGSSGGHLSLMAGLTGDDGNPDSDDPVEQVSSRVQAIVAWFPPTDLINWGREGGYEMINNLRPDLLGSLFEELTDIEAQLKSISPIYFVSPDDPPVYLIHGDRDMTVPVQQSHIFKDRYEAEGLPVSYVEVPGGGHTYWVGIQDQYPAIGTWFRDHLK